MSSGGMSSRSIIQKDKECLICRATRDLHKHHIYFGPNRSVSEKYGFWCWLCPRHHNMSSEGVHFDHEFDLALKRRCQRVFEEKHDRKEFMELIGRNYL